jgi:hypothetical protein
MPADQSGWLNDHLGFTSSRESLGVPRGSTSRHSMVASVNWCTNPIRIEGQLLAFAGMLSLLPLPSFIVTI